MRRETQMMPQHDIIGFLKRAREFWIVTTVNGAAFFSDQRAIVECAETEAHSGLSGPEAKQWASAITRLMASVPDGYAPAIAGCLCGEFGNDYVRLYSSAGTFTYLNEVYVRAVGDAIPWMHLTDSGQAVYFVRDGRVVASIMPVKGLGGRDLSEEPEVPFLEDAVLYHECRKGEE